MSDAGLAALLPLAVAIPLAGACISPLLARLSPHLTLLVSMLGMVGSLVILALAAPRVYGGKVLTHYLGGWVPVHGAALGIAFAADSFGITFALLSAGIGAVLLMYTLSELGGLGARETGGFAALMQLLMAGLIGAALTADTVDLFVWFEVAALASYGLTAFFLDRPIALEAAFKILVLTTIAGFAVFVGAGVLYDAHGALNYGQLEQAVAQTASSSTTAHLDVVALGLLIAGFATKAGLVPFHGWLADAHTAAPGPVSALFSGLMVNLGVIAIGRLALQIFPGAHTPVLGAVMVIGLVSSLLGSAMALVQQDLKRLLAYDTVSQTGIMAVGLATGTAPGVAGAVYHLVSHALFKSLLFLCAGAIVHRTGETELNRMGGLVRRWPGLTAAFLVGAASIAGIPPLNGYVSLGLIHSALLAGHQYVPYALTLCAQVLTIGALGRATWLAFLRPREDYERHEKLRPGMLAGLSTLAACCLLSGIFPNFVLDRLMSPAAAALLHPAAYAKAVMSGNGAVAIPPLMVPYEYLDPAEIAAVAGTLLLGIALVYLYQRRRREPLVIRALRAVHNGSANDYAAYAVGGVVVLVAALAWL